MISSGSSHLQVYVTALKISRKPLKYRRYVFAALSADRRKLVVSVVNPTETSQDCELNPTGIQIGGPARLCQLTAPAGAVAPQSGRGGPFGSGPPATMTETSLPEAPRTFTLPPTSISVYEFEVRQ